MSAALAGKRCLVLGAGGFIGINLAAGLACAGAHVRGFGRRPRLANAHLPLDWIDAEFAETSAHQAALADVTHVFHLLGGSNPGANNADPAREIEASVAPSLAWFNACADAGIEKLVFASSGGTVYGSPDVVPIPEDAPTRPVSVYGTGKRTIEMFLENFARYRELDAAILRIANPYGPWQAPDRGQGFIARAMRCAVAGETLELWGDGGVVRDFVYIDDVVAALVAVATQGPPGRAYNIGSGIGRSLEDVIAAVAEASGRELQVHRKAGRASDVPINVLDCSRALQELGWQPRVPWREGLIRTRDWIATLA